MAHGAGVIPLAPWTLAVPALGEGSLNGDHHRSNLLPLITEVSQYEMIWLQPVMITHAVTLPTPSTISHLGWVGLETRRWRHCGHLTPTAERALVAVATCGLSDPA